MKPELIILEIYNKLKNRFPSYASYGENSSILSISNKVTLAIYKYTEDSIILDFSGKTKSFSISVISPNKPPRFLLAAVSKRGYKEEAELVQEINTYAQELMKSNSVKFIEDL